MRRAAAKRFLLCLAYVFIFPSSCALYAAQTTTIKKGQKVNTVKVISTAIALHEKNRKLYLEINPAPDRFELYAEKRKLANVRGKGRTRFDISRYAKRSENGRLRVSAIDTKGKKINQTLDVTKYLTSLKRSTGTVSMQKRRPAIAAGKEKSEDGKSSTVRTSEKNAAGTEASRGISAFLQGIEKARSLKDLEQDLREADLSNAEMRQLAEAIKENRYRSKLERIARRETSNRKAVKLSTKSSHTPENQIRGTVSESHLQRLKKIKRDFEIQTRSLKRAKPAVLSGAATGTSSIAANVRNDRMAAQSRRSVSSNWRIDSISPTAIQIGRNANVRGNGFGETQGHIALVFQGAGGREEVLECRRIVSWSDDRIVVTIPEEAAELTAGKDTDARVWVKIAGGEIGPMHAITLRPDFSLLPPEITRMSDTLVIPEQPFLIQGRNFLSGRQGAVLLQFVGKDFPTEVQAWDNEAIKIKVPNIIRLMETSGWIVVRNHAGYIAKAPIRFEPKLWVDEIRGPSDGAGGDLVSAGCSPWLGSEYSTETDPAWLLCLFGEKKEKHLIIRLQNDYRVVQGYTELFNGQGYLDRVECGAHFEQGPVAGSKAINTRRITWANALSRCQFLTFFTIEGPAGVSYRDTYDPNSACIDRPGQRPETPVDCRW